MRRETKSGLVVLGALLGTAGTVYALSKAEPEVIARIKWHSDAEFDIGSTHEAVVTVTNPTRATWNYNVELLVGDFYDLSQNILLVGGASGPLSYSVTMPNIEDSYAVAVKIYNADTDKLIHTFPFAKIVVKTGVIVPTIPWGYDFDGSGYIERSEYDQALLDYTAGLIRNDLYQMVHALYKYHVRYGQIKGDFNDDGLIDHADFDTFALYYNTVLGDDAYNPVGDMDSNNKIDIYDFVLFAGVYEASVEASLTWT